MNQPNLQLLRPLLLLFVVLNAFFLAGGSWLSAKGFDRDVLIIGNLILFTVSLVSFIITRKSFNSSNPNVFVRAVYAGFIIKFFVIAIAAFAYIMAVKKNVNKPALFACMVLYILYTFLEVSALLRLLKKKKDA